MKEIVVTCELGSWIMCKVSGLVLASSSFLSIHLLSSWLVMQCQFTV